MRRHSLFWQLVLGLSIMVGLLWLGAAAIATTVISRSINGAYDYALEQAANRLLPLAIHDIREPGERRRIAPTDSDGRQFSYAVLGRDGQIILNDGDVPELVLSAGVRDGVYNTALGRAYGKSDPRSGFRIVVLEAEDERQEAMVDGIWALVGPLAALLPLVALGVWLALRLALAPVQRLRQALAERGRHNLAPLNALDYPPELSPIVAELAALFDRLQQALDAERAFAASSAHELRTPIAGALAQTQLLASALTDHPAFERTAKIERALRRLSNLAERLLQLARLEAGFARSTTELKLLPILELIVRDFRVGGADVKLTVEPGANPTAFVDADAFALVLRNLIYNAVRHGKPGGPIDVKVDADGEIRIINGGPVVGDDTMASLGRPFVRGQTDASGSGIGLSIVRAIAEQVGGSMLLLSPAWGRDDGFEVRLRL